MQTMYGADSDELDRIAQQMLREADTIDDQSRLLAGNLRSIAWLGPIVEEFQSFWNSQLLGSVSTSTTFLREAASGLQRQAQEQRTASAAKNGGGFSFVNADSDRSDPDDGIIADGRRVHGSFTPADPLYEPYYLPFGVKPEGADPESSWTTDSVEPNDLKQGRIGDCYLITGLSVIADQNPDLIRDAIVDNGNGTYTVRFFNKEGEPEYVTVTAEFPTFEMFKNGEWTPDGSAAGPGDGELWPRIMEKAYGQWISGEETLAGIYGRLTDGGRASNVYAALSGHPSTSYYKDSPLFTRDFPSLTELNRIHDQGGALSLSSLNGPDGDTTTYTVGDHTLHHGHAYWIDEIDVVEDTVTIQNPWGYGTDKIVMTYDEFTEAFDRVDTNEL